MPERFGWGGARENAGRKEGPRPRTRHLARTGIRAYLPVHVTIRFRGDLPLLAGDVFFDVLLWAIRRTTGVRGTSICAYSAQGDHVHLLVETESLRALAQAMTTLGGRIARTMNQILERRGPVFDGRYHAHVLETRAEVRHALRYLVHNAVKHAADRWTSREERDPFATLGTISLGPFAELGRRATGPLVTDPPRTWLLRGGWHGEVWTPAQDYPET